MEYLPQRRWSALEKKKANIMIKAIDKQLKERRMIRSLEKFVEHQSDTEVIIVKMKILLEPTSNKFMVGLKTAGYRVTTAGSRLLLLVRKSILLKEVTTAS
ncbi:hypothetical protein Tco_1111727 [Tanacetum coccineum]|uniref:Uncharacterized protein n=1 Tax=Tanacetum coccineum TaxID=301880 RepID=A0ABQ5IME9_9ASTR